jgi:hypothetical protein
MACNRLSIAAVSGAVAGALQNSAGVVSHLASNAPSAAAHTHRIIALRFIQSGPPAAAASSCERYQLMPLRRYLGKHHPASPFGPARSPVQGAR